jgi:hypothetical protein
MTTTRYLYAVVPDGTVVKRRTHREYTWAVLVRSRGTWVSWGWSSRQDLAMKAYNQAKQFYGPGDVVLVAATGVKP